MAAQSYNEGKEEEIKLNRKIKTLLHKNIRYVERFILSTNILTTIFFKCYYSPRPLYTNGYYLFVSSIKHQQSIKNT